MSGLPPQLTVYADGPTAVSARQLNTLIQTCQTAAQLRGLIGITGMAVGLQGITAPGDGLSGQFYWNTASTAPDDNMNVIVPSGSVQGAWIRLLPFDVPSGGITQVATGQFYQNLGATINRFNDRVMVAAATVNDCDTPNIVKDWLTILQAATFGAGAPVPTSTMVVLAASTLNEAFLAGAQTLTYTDPNSSAIAVQGYGYANNAAGFGAHAWAYYGEAHRLRSTDGNAYGIEISVGQQGGAPVPQTPYSGNLLGLAIGIQIDSGNGFNAAQEPGLTSASSAITVVQNTTDNSAPFLRGLIFSQAALLPTNGISEAISFPQATAMIWYAPSGNQTTAILSNTSNFLEAVSLSFSDANAAFSSQASALPILTMQGVTGGQNSLVVTNSVTGTPPNLFATGVDANIGIVFTPKGTGAIVSEGLFQPGTDNAFSLGATSARWSAVWAANGTIQTSQADMKTDIEPLPSMLSLVTTLHPITYRWKSGGAKPVVSQAEVDEPVYETTTETAEDHEVQPDGTVHLVSVTSERRRQVFDELPVTLPNGTPVIDKVAVRRRGLPDTYRSLPRTHRVPRMQKVTRDVVTHVDQPGKRTHWGFLASDVKAAMATTGLDFGGYVLGEDGTEGLRTDQLLPVLWKACQELAAEVAALKAAKT